MSSHKRKCPNDFEKQIKNKSWLLRKNNNNNNIKIGNKQMQNNLIPDMTDIVMTKKEKIDWVDKYKNLEYLNKPNVSNLFGYMKNVIANI